MIDPIKYPSCLVPDNVFKRSTVKYCGLCNRVTMHSSLNGSHYRCNNCSRGFCEMPIIPVGSLEYPNMVYNKGGV